jgi:hypothetical protein
MARQVIGQSSLQPLELESLDSHRLYVVGASATSRVKSGNASQDRAAAKSSTEARRQFELLERPRQKALAEWRAAGKQRQEEIAAELFLVESIRDHHRA